VVGAFYHAPTSSVLALSNPFHSVFFADRTTQHKLRSLVYHEWQDLFAPSVLALSSAIESERQCANNFIRPYPPFSERNTIHARWIVQICESLFSPLCGRSNVQQIVNQKAMAIRFLTTPHQRPGYKSVLLRLVIHGMREACRLDMSTSCPSPPIILGLRAFFLLVSVC
jgi:hypothetical protein